MSLHAHPHCARIHITTSLRTVRIFYILYPFEAGFEPRLTARPRRRAYLLRRTKQQFRLMRGRVGCAAGREWRGASGKGLEIGRAGGQLINPKPLLDPRFRSRANVRPRARPPVSLRPANLLLNTAEWDREKQISNPGNSSPD